MLLILALFALALANGPLHDAHAARRALAFYDDARHRRKVERAAARRSDLS